MFHFSDAKIQEPYYTMMQNVLQSYDIFIFVQELFLFRS